MKLPNTVILLFGILLMAYVLTWVLPSGTYETHKNESGSELVVPGSFKLLDENINLPFWSVLTAIPRGLHKAQGIIFFVLILGGTFAIIRSTGTIDAFISWLLYKFNEKPGTLIFLCILVFAVGGSTYGMGEETIPLVGIMVIMCRRLRMDSITAVAIIIIGTGVGYGAAAINPFTVVIAQNIAGLTPLSGIYFRIIMFIPFFLIGFFYVWRYGKKVRLDPSNSLAATNSEKQPSVEYAPAPLKKHHLLVIGLTAASFMLLVWGSMRYEWYTNELSAIFLGLAIMIGLVSKYSLNEVAVLFTKGVTELASLVMIFGIATAIEITLTDAKVLHTIVFYMSNMIDDLGTELAAVGMLAMQSIINFFIPSGSGQALVSMPIMAPLSDVVGINRQVAVLAFQMGDGFTNIIIPTGVVLMTILGVAEIPYDRWLRFVWPLYLQLILMAIVVIVFAVFIGYS